MAVVEELVQHCVISCNKKSIKAKTTTGLQGTGSGAFRPPLADCTCWSLAVLRPCYSRNRRLIQLCFTLFSQSSPTSKRRQFFKNKTELLHMVSFPYCYGRSYPGIRSLFSPGKQVSVSYCSINNSRFSRQLTGSLVSP